MFIFLLVVVALFGAWCYYLGYKRGRDKGCELSYIRGYNEGVLQKVR
jgi:hypothetical protein